MADCMVFPKHWEKFLEDYSFKDKEEIYTNGARLIPTFRVEQMMEHYLQEATENAVHVVRCKDCKRFEVCFPTPNIKKIHEHAFCSYGERRTDV